MARNVTFKFGVLSFAAKLAGAVEPKPDMANLCKGQPGEEAHDPLPVKAPKSCAVCGPITSHEGLVKGIKRGSAYTLVDAAEVAEAKESFAGQYKGVLDFVPHPTEQVVASTAPGDSLNYLTPADAGGADHYQLMAKLVREHPELTFVALHTPVSSTGMYVLAVRGDVLVVEKRERGAALRPAPSVGGSVNEQLYEMLAMQLGIFVSDFDPAKYEDGYVAALKAMAEGGETISIGTAQPAATAPKASDEDLMAKLQSLAGGKPAKKATPRKRTAKKTTPKVTAA